jgi:hypothetical protein
MEQSIISAAVRQVLYRRDFQITLPEVEPRTMCIGDIELDPARRTIKNPVV